MARARAGKTGATTAEERARARAKSLSDLIWHVGAYVIVNAFLWVLDLMDGSLDWAYWTTIPWGIGLLFHVVAYSVEGSGFEERKYQQYLEEERRREPPPP